MDEFHFYSEPDRGWAWQVPLLELPQAQFVLMSATLGDVTRFVDDLTRRTGRETAVVTSADRPVPLTYHWALTPLHETLEELLTTHQAPVYVVHFTQAAALERAQALTSINVCTREEKDRIAELIGGFRFSPGFGKTLSRLVRHGIGVHHAGMLPKYRRLVEQLAQAGLLKVICGTDTLGRRHQRADPHRGVHGADASTTAPGSAMLKAREFHQIAGRAGRAGLRHRRDGRRPGARPCRGEPQALAKAGDDPKKLRKVQRKKPPEGQVTWTEDTFDRLVAAEPEPLQSRMRVTHSMLLNVLARDDDPFEAMRAPAARQPRGRPRAGPPGATGGRASSATCWPPVSWRGWTLPTRTAAPSGRGGAAVRLRAEPAAVDVRPRRLRHAGPRRRRRTPSTSSR